MDGHDRRSRCELEQLPEASPGPGSLERTVGASYFYPHRLLEATVKRLARVRQRQYGVCQPSGQVVDDVEGHIAVDRPYAFQRYAFGPLREHEGVKRPPGEGAALEAEDARRNRAPETLG